MCVAVYVAVCLCVWQCVCSAPMCVVVYVAVCLCVLQCMLQCAYVCCSACCSVPMCVAVRVAVCLCVLQCVLQCAYQRRGRANKLQDGNTLLILSYQRVLHCVAVRVAVYVAGCFKVCVAVRVAVCLPACVALCCSVLQCVLQYVYQRRGRAFGDKLLILS